MEGSSYRGYPRNYAHFYALCLFPQNPADVLASFVVCNSTLHQASAANMAAHTSTSTKFSQKKGTL